MYSVLAALSPYHQPSCSHWLGGFWVLDPQARLCLRAEQPVKRPAGSLAGPQAKSMSPSSALGSPELRTVPVVRQALKDLLNELLSLNCPIWTSLGQNG